MLVTRNSNTVLVSLLNLSHITRLYEGNLKEALRLLDDAYSIREVLGLKHHWTAIIWMYRGNVYLDKENYSYAATCYSKAVKGISETEGHPQILAKVLRKYGIALKKAGNLIEAEHQLRQSLKVAEKMAKENKTPDTSVEDDENVKEAMREIHEVTTLAQSKY